jgi:hypothetical protein
MPVRVALALAVLFSTSTVAATSVAYAPLAHAQPVHSSTSPALPSLREEHRQDPRGPAFGVYRPVFPNDLSAVDEYEGASGARMDIVHWYALWGGWKSAFSRTDLETVARRGSLPMITWEPWAGRPDDPAWSLRDAILSGQHDVYIESWARGMAEYGGPVLLRFAHEMHHQSYPWAVGRNGNTAEEYVAAWRYIRDAFARHGAANIEWVWNPNTIGRADAAEYGPIYRALYPGDEYVDWVGLDIYNTGPALDWGAPAWRGFGEILAAPYDAITAITDKPVLLPEVGSAESGGSKAAWIRDAIAVQLPSRFTRVRALIWFDLDKEERWALRSSPEAFEAWSGTVGQPVARRP